MGNEEGPTEKPQADQDSAVDAQRREALVKIGRFSAYVTPLVLASVSAAYGAPVSGAPTPSPPPPCSIKPGGLVGC